MKHWAFDYLGKPWLIGGRGPDTFDCWGLVYCIYRDHYGILLPSYPTITSKNLLAVTKYITNGATSSDSDWVRLDNPVDGCVVALSKNNRILHHVGIYLTIDKGMVLHATDAGSVIAQPITDLKRWGWSRIEYYTHKDYQNDGSNSRNNQPI